MSEDIHVQLMFPCKLSIVLTVGARLSIKLCLLLVLSVLKTGGCMHFGQVKSYCLLLLVPTARGNFPVLKRNISVVQGAFSSACCRFYSLLTFKEPKLIWPSACAFYSLTVTSPNFVSARSLIERTIFMARVLSHAVWSICL